MEIVGKSKNISYFENSIKNRRLHHFYIFEGQDGVGKKTLARYIARMIHCESDTKPCGVCSSCIKHLSGNHPDFYEVNDTSDKAKITVETARKTVEDIFVKPLLADKKIYLIDDEKLIEPDVQNILLKVLEEPPAYTVIIMNVTSTEKLLQTVRSRAIKVRVEPCSSAEILHYLKENFPDTEYPDLITQLSGGNLGAAEKMVSGADYFTARKELYDILSQDRQDNIIRLEKFFSDKDNVLRNLNLLMFWLRDAICITGGGKIINADYERYIKEFTKSRDKSSIMRAADAAAEMCSGYKKGSNIGIWTESLISKLW